MATKQSHRFIRLPQVQKLTSLSQAEIYERMKMRTFPATVRPNHGRTVWSESEVTKWVEACIAEAGEVAVLMDKMKGCPQESNLQDSSVQITAAQAQRARLYAQLQLGPVSTIEARRDLNIMAPAARIKELRESGVPVLTHLQPLHDEQGRHHRRVAIYYLADSGQEVA
ncbi:helix-turn-helix domain-containing protein [Pseudomonas oryzihabitans]|uniref:helix-turn-helix domain-containing protein n=1 Tax=Pseudomonas oryzihabitans TaxID=47885 RepID=UPI0028953E64|nr:helix-turn-helix domain-containing protein [Pseudomonas oryzihabitans]MDT3718727.1 helix-turn-helix domain-containing protein [Pseudomonas oryzihabitans]